MVPWFKWGGGLRKGASRNTGWLVALGFCGACTGEPRPPVTSPTAAVASARAPALGAAAPATSELAATPLAPYEPEVPQGAPELSSREAQRLLGAQTTPAIVACSRWREPVTHLCLMHGLRALSFVAELPSKVTGDEAAAESETLSKIEGCGTFPGGAVRWIRARRMPSCAPELAQSALGEESVEVDAAVRGLLVGEALAEQCRRGVEPMPPYRGAYTPQRFELWRQNELAPWHERTLAQLSQCHAVVAALAPGTPGRAAALIGHAQARAKFAHAHRVSPIGKPLSEDYAQRTAYYAALDGLARPLLEQLDAASEEATQEAAREGDTASYVAAFAGIVPRQTPLSLFALPPLPPMGPSSRERILSRWPVQISTSSAEVSDAASAEQTLTAISRSGLPKALRGRVGALLVDLPASDASRRRVHGILAAGLLRLGLVTRDRSLFERAEYELRYADHGTTEAWLAALTRALLTPQAQDALIPKFAHWTSPADLRQAPDVSGFSQELLATAARPDRYASIAVDYAILRSVTPSAVDNTASMQSAVRFANRPGVPRAVARCVNDWAGVCGWAMTEFGEDERDPCACTPFPWRVEP